MGSDSDRYQIFKFSMLRNPRDATTSLLHPNSFVRANDLDVENLKIQQTPFQATLNRAATSKDITTTYRHLVNKLLDKSDEITETIQSSDLYTFYQRLHDNEKLWEIPENRTTEKILTHATAVWNFDGSQLGSILSLKSYADAIELLIDFLTALKIDFILDLQKVREKVFKVNQYFEADVKKPKYDQWGYWDDLADIINRYEEQTAAKNEQNELIEERRETENELESIEFFELYNNIKQIDEKKYKIGTEISKFGDPDQLTPLIAEYNRIKENLTGEDAIPSFDEALTQYELVKEEESKLVEVYKAQTLENNYLYKMLHAAKLLQKVVSNSEDLTRQKDITEILTSRFMLAPELIDVLTKPLQDKPKTITPTSRIPNLVEIEYQLKSKNLKILYDTVFNLALRFGQELDKSDKEDEWRTGGDGLITDDRHTPEEVDSDSGMDDLSVAPDDDTSVAGSGTAIDSEISTTTDDESSAIILREAELMARRSLDRVRRHGGDIEAIRMETLDERTSRARSVAEEGEPIPVTPPPVMSETEAEEGPRISNFIVDYLNLKDQLTLLDVLTDLDRSLTGKFQEIEELMEISNQNFDRLLNLIDDESDEVEVKYLAQRKNKKSYSSHQEQEFKPRAVRPIGFLDNIVVRQEAVKYKKGEIAHIENILPGELKEREHRISTSIEELIETESTSENEESTQTTITDRFEMQKESEEVLQSKFNIDSDVWFQYRGGSYTVEATTKAGYTTSKTQTDKTAQNFARDVTSVASSRTLQKSKSLRRTITTRLVEDTNTHTLENKTLEPIGGVYRWLNKIYKVEMRNYGTRLMIEFYVPEPGVYLRDDRVQQSDPISVKEFKLTPDQIHENNYMEQVHLYSVTGVRPPPQEQIMIAKGLNFDGSADNGNITKLDSSLEVPSGYRAREAYWNYSMKVKGNVGYYAALISNRYIYRFRNYATRQKIERGSSPINMGYESGSIPISILAWNIEGLVFNVRLKCTRNKKFDLYKKWQLETHERIMAAYNRKVQEKEDLINTISTEEGIQIEGRNPIENRELEKNEIKKAAIQLLRRVPYNFDAIDENTMNPTKPISINVTKANEDSYIVQFYERAFGWNQMTHILYPYMWARTEEWWELLQYQSNDPLHVQFMRAGAARVLIPVTPGYELTVLKLLENEDMESNEVDKIRNVITTAEQEIESGNFTFSMASPNIAIWQELQLAHNDEFSYGSGVLSVRKNKKDIKAVGWSGQLKNSDLKREIIIEGTKYVIDDVIDEEFFILDRDYEGTDNTKGRYNLGSVLVGDPWEVIVPTSLVVIDNSKGEVEFEL